MGHAEQVEKLLKSRVEAAIQAGRDLSDMQIGMLRVALTVDPDTSPTDRDELAKIEASINRGGVWRHSYEWRIFTETDVSIQQTKQGDETHYAVEVACGDQRLASVSRDLRRAYVHMRIYERIIMDGFYSVGPPWL